MNIWHLSLTFITAVYFSNYPRDEREKLSGGADDSKEMTPIAGKSGITLELCAGIVDKSTDLKQTAKAEVLEECGYDVPISAIEEIITYRYDSLYEKIFYSLFIGFVIWTNVIMQNSC